MGPEQVGRQQGELGVAVGTLEVGAGARGDAQLAETRVDVADGLAGAGVHRVEHRLQEVARRSFCSGKMRSLDISNSLKTVQICLFCSRVSLASLCDIILLGC